MDWTLSSIYWVLGAMDKTIASYAGFLGTYVFLSGLILTRTRLRLWSYLLIWAAYPLACMWLAFFIGRDIFDALNLTAMGVFVGGPALLAVSAFFAWPAYKRFASFFIFNAVLLTVIGVDAFILEPTSLEVRHETVETAKIDKPFRIAVISDLQTDRVGDFEEHVLRTALNEQPDMVLLPGDYIQADMKQHAEQVQKLHDLLSRLNFAAPLGVYATQGDSERKDWQNIFAELPITTFGKSETIETGNGITITGLTLKDSWRLHYPIPDSNKFHIVVAHRPDFMLNAPAGDLLIAGHTHGGQVQLPFYGPLLTFSEAPRRWCAGCAVKRPDGKTFVITKGIGMERGRAPRLRFFCRPEIVIIDVKPTK